MLSDTYQPPLQLGLTVETKEQAIAATSPRLSIPLSALANLTQPNQIPLNNAVIDIQHLQAFLMTLQPQLNQATGANFESSASTDDPSTLSAFQGGLPCAIEAGATVESDATATASTGLMMINESFPNRPLDYCDQLGKSNEEVALSPSESFKHFNFLSHLTVLNSVNCVWSAFLVHSCL